MHNIFSIYHPAVNLAYILTVLVCVMLTLNPVYVALSFYLGSLYLVYLTDLRRYGTSLRFTLVMFVIVALANPLFNHRGMTVLFYLFDNPVTFEALLYGLCSAGMLMSVLIWFGCYNALITNEKFLFLFARFLPGIALMISMVIKLVPVTKRKIEQIRIAQQAMGLGTGMGNRKQRISRGIRVTSILMSWSMEDSLETADSMKARGYGCGKRTSFSVYKFCAHDWVAIVLIGISAVLNLGFIVLNLAQLEFYPRLSGDILSGVSVCGYFAYALLLAYPMLLELWEELKWASLRSKA
jgi:energy-coupling factor transport system permease protein